MSLDLVNSSNILKTRYTTEEIRNVASAAHVGYSKIRFEQDFTGNGDLIIPIEYANPSQIGGGFAATRTTPGGVTDNQSTRWGKFTLKRRFQYLFPRVHASVTKATADADGAFFDAASNELKRIAEEFGNRMGLFLYKSGSGSLGQIAAGGISGNILTLAEPRDAKNLKIGQRIVVSLTDGGNPKAGETYIVNQLINQGKVVVNNLADITGTAAALDFIGAAGDFPAGGAAGLDASLGAGAYHGFEGWIPPTDPVAGSDSWFGQDRGIAPEMLAGSRVTQVTGQTLKELLMDLETTIWDRGGKGELIALTSPQNRNILAKQLGSEVQREPGNGSFGFRFVDFDGNNRTVRVYGDPDCSRKRIFMIDPSTWVFHTAMDFPDWEDYSGAMWRLLETSDYYEGRGRAWGNLACHAPRDNGVAVLL